ncbi:MAG: Lipid A core-O-antigen ligase-like protein enyme, partial [Candidatus Woesebacteria bacterium GW2011_GWE1_41_24]
YSTFPHPNALAGFIGLTAIFLIFNRFISNKVLMTFGYLLISVVFILAFSMSAYIAFFICIILYFVFKLKIFNQKALTLFIVLMSLLSFYLTNFSKSFRERLVLANISGEMISENWVVGAGLNTFIIKETVYGNLENSVWLLQPVHNIYLLVLTEVGLSGIILLSLVLYRFLKNCIKSKNIWGVLSIIFILTTGLFDHYWFTIQQNMLLISLLLGLSLREK